MNIVEFLEARIAEDEERAGSGWSRLGNTRWETDNYGRDHLTPFAVLAECKAKRAIMKDAFWDTLTALATVYADHPDYREEWRHV